ncbi:hypothetical protein DUNSADRAFT_15450 [Dunaliella salina]|uniref:Uncharacterized protein n=1 Tax=Dunaliella salina TaxID=3046 RepID=A0ABQ7G5C4_DUNSA|nr:hypothetical protein DUNSADRAFT_15450 [Dunaliella salina]|eukprot:KAF5829809.1 hypothetical protein DUNSADRAFT_15450 [Dunaliella salina]
MTAGTQSAGSGGFSSTKKSSFLGLEDLVDLRETRTLFTAFDRMVRLSSGTRFCFPCFRSCLATFFPIFALAVGSSRSFRFTIIKEPKLNSSII